MDYLYRSRLLTTGKARKEEEEEVVEAEALTQKREVLQMQEKKSARARN